MLKILLELYNFSVIIVIDARGWRNWQTRKIQALMSLGLCGFESHLSHQKTPNYSNKLSSEFCFLRISTEYPLGILSINNDLQQMTSKLAYSIWIPLKLFKIAICRSTPIKMSTIRQQESSNQQVKPSKVDIDSI